MLLEQVVVILGIFEPCEIHGQSFVDGGIRENIPWKALKQYGADKIISIVFTQNGTQACCHNLINVIDCSLNYIMEELREYELFGNVDLISINTDKINLLDSSKIDELYKKGYTIGKDYIKKNF